MRRPSTPYDYVVKRLVPIDPKPALEGRRSIKPLIDSKQGATISNGYFILIPVTVHKLIWNDPLPEHSSQEDINYMKTLREQLSNEEDGDRSMAMDALKHMLPIADAENDSISSTGSSIPTTRKILVDDCTSSSNDRVIEWLLASEINSLESKTMFVSHSFQAMLK